MQTIIRFLIPLNKSNNDSHGCALVDKIRHLGPGSTLEIVLVQRQKRFAPVVVQGLKVLITPIAGGELPTVSSTSLLDETMFEARHLTTSNSRQRAGR